MVIWGTCGTEVAILNFFSYFLFLFYKFSDRRILFSGTAFFSPHMSFERFCCSYYFCGVVGGGGGAHADFASDLLKLCCKDDLHDYFVTSYMVGQKDKRTNNRTMLSALKGPVRI